MTPLRYLRKKKNVKNFFLFCGSLHFSLCFTFEKELKFSLLFLNVLVEKHSSYLSHLYTSNLPLLASTYIGILLALQSTKSILLLHLFTELSSSALATDFWLNLTNFNLSWLLMATLTILLHSHLPRRSNNSTSHLDMDPKNVQFIFTFYDWEMLQPNLKSKLLQPFRIATLLLKH